MRSFISILFFFISLFNEALAQKNEEQAVIYNIASGAIFSGIGSVINKKKEERLLPTFMKGLAKGVLGGALVYGSKKFIFEYSKSANYTYIWPANLLNNFGNAIIENGARNEPAFSKLHINIGFIRLESLPENRKKIHFKILPMALYGFAYTSTLGKFNLPKTLKSGHTIFETDEIRINTNSRFDFDGVVIVSSVLIENGVFEPHKILGHEIIHVFQYNEFLRLNTYLMKPEKNWVNHQNKSVQFLKKWFYLDWTNFVNMEVYRLFDGNQDCYFDNFFEREANLYSHRISCQ